MTSLRWLQRDDERGLAAARGGGCGGAGWVSDRRGADDLDQLEQPQHAQQLHALDGAGDGAGEDEDL